MNNKQLNQYDGATRVLQTAALYPLKAKDFPDDARQELLNSFKRSEVARVRIVIAKALGIDDAELARKLSKFQEDLSDDQLYSKIKLAIVGIGG